MLTTFISFEDQGQDFTQWAVNEQGTVMSCQPFQSNVWTQWLVTNLEQLQVGGQVEVVHPTTGETGKIIYPIASLDLINTP